jgi:prephenate dehydrogenase
LRIALVGVGLIGGSIGLAARERLGASVAGYDSSDQALSTAVERGAVDRVCEDVGEAVGDAEAVFVAVPVGALVGTAQAALAVAPDACVISDVGSTKRAIVAALDDPRFVGGHPLAGAETSGVQHARADLFDGATWYLTPTPTTSGILYERLHRLLHSLGARPMAIEPEIHDTILATVSHLPHVLANVLVAQAAQTLAAGGERLRHQHVGQHVGQVGHAGIDDTIARLNLVRDALAAADTSAVTDWNDAAAADRRRLLEAQLAGGPLFELRASVPNRPGVVAQLALELGRSGVNITDMALYPAPDMSEGVIALWIAGEEQARRTEELVGRLGFPVARA